MSVVLHDKMKNLGCSGPDPGFPLGGHGPIFEGFWPPMWAHFIENVWENERIGSYSGACAGMPPRSAYGVVQCYV